MSFKAGIGSLTVLALLAPAMALGQADQAMWQRGTTLSVFGGGAFTSNHEAPLIGAALGWEFTPRLAVEGGAAWLRWNERSDGFSADLRVRVPILSARPVVPYIAGGVGLHRASFDSPGDDLPPFYRARATGSRPRLGATAAFTDPTLVLAGGLDIFVTRTMAVRPDVSAAVVMRDGRTRTLATAAIHLAYHFEEHLAVPRRLGSR